MLVEMHHMTALFPRALTETQLDIQNLAEVSTSMMTLIIKHFPKEYILVQEPCEIAREGVNTMAVRFHCN
jgi:hypothetical protein